MRRDVLAALILVFFAGLAMVNCGGGSSSTTTTAPLNASVSVASMTPAPGSTINWSSPVQFSITVDYYFEGVDANIFGGWVDTNDEIAVVGPNGNGDYLDTLLTGSNSGSFTYTWTETVDPHTTDPLIRNNPYQFYVGIITASVSFLDPNPPPPDLRVGYDELIVYFY